MVGRVTGSLTGSNVSRYALTVHCILMHVCFLVIYADFKDIFVYVCRPETFDNATKQPFRHMLDLLFGESRLPITDRLEKFETCRRKLLIGSNSVNHRKPLNYFSHCVWNSACGISPPCFVAEYCKRLLNQGCFFACMRMFVWVFSAVNIFLFVAIILSVSASWLAVETTSVNCFGWAVNSVDAIVLWQ